MHSLKLQWSNWSLAAKLTLTITLSIVMAVGGVTLLFIRREQQTFHTELQQQADLLLNTLEASTADQLYYLDADYLSDIVYALGVERRILVSGRIYDAQGRIVADASRRNLSYSLESDPFGQHLIASDTTIFKWQPNQLLAGRAVIVGRQRVGAISVGLTTAPLHAKVASVRNHGFGVALTAAVSGTLLALLFSRTITNPLQELVKATRRIANGELTQRIEVRSGDELAVLADAFNEMTAQLQQTLVRKGAILQFALDPIITIDCEGRIIEFNPAAERTFGYCRTEVLGRELAELIFPSPWREELRADVARYLATGEGCLLGKRIEVTAKRADDAMFPIEFSISCIPVNGPPMFTVLARDITERKQGEIALRESEERYALAISGANDGIWDWHLITNETYFSPRWKSMLGYQDEIGNSPQEWFSRVHPADLKQLQADIAAHIAALTPHFENEYRMLRQDGTYHWMLSRGLAIRDENGTAYRMAGSQTDITSRKQAESQLRHDAFHDALTHLPNRALFMERLRHVVACAQQHQGRSYAVLFLDFDRFKVINDSLGHMVGDQLLIGIARRLEACLRSSDTVARLGGDEFVILLEDIKDVNEAKSVANRIQQGLTQSFNLSGHEVIITASIGIVLSETGYDRSEDILRDADTAMYRAKTLGKARYTIFDAKMRADAVARLELETDLRRALERQQFHLHYQPIVSLKTNKIAGFEALLRWQHPNRGFISPAEFIPLAEETELIVPIGEWVLGEACRQMHDWKAQFPTVSSLAVTVNLSSKQIAQPNLPEQIENVLQETGLDATSLKLEITEGVIMENIESTCIKLESLRSLGMQIYVDDFGTGYSSFSYLQNLPVSTLKIDRAFVRRIDADENSWQIVQTIMTLAEGLGMGVIAEGVETAEQLAHLKTLGCKHVQGYFISKPLNSAAATAMLAGNLHLNCDSLRLSESTF